MTDKKSTHWITAIGLITAFLAMVTAYYAMEEKRQAVAEKENQEVLNAAALKRQQEAYQQQRQADLTAQTALLAAQAAAQEHETICQGHQSNRATIESRFSLLMQEHGVLMNSIKSCLNQENNDDQKNCALTVCAGAYFFTNGQSNCVSTIAEAASIKEDLNRENLAAESNKCEIPRSNIAEFFK